MKKVNFFKITQSIKEMKSHISILHISDLHKAVNDNYQNLMVSLKYDCEKYTQHENIKKPDIVVVSGDIIKGGSDNEIAQQYSESTAFLTDVVNYFLDGNKERIIIIPGNHDIDWNVSKSSMRKIELDLDRESIVKYYLSGSSKYRWSWNELCFYQISDKQMYNNRFGHFIEFYNSFYDGDRNFSTNTDEQYQIYDYPEFNISFIAFNSCYENDHLNYAGKINPTCITKASGNLRILHEKGRLLIAVWHHNTSGQPFENNYLDRRILGAMIDQNIMIGLHGHQHVCGIVNEFKSVFDEKKIVILSSGTLYGYKESLPHGSSRQYNIIEIKNTEEEQRRQYKITVHSREDVDNDLFEIPQWNKGRIDKTHNSSWSTMIDQPMVHDIRISLSKIMEEAERTGDFNSAVKELKYLNLKDLSVRKVLVDYLDKIQDNGLTCELLMEPQNNEESIILMNSASEIGDTTLIEKVLKIPIIKDSEDASIKKIRQYLNFQLTNYGTN